MDSHQVQPEPLAKRVQARLAASRFLTFSLLIHVIIVVMAGSVVLFKRAMEAPDFSAGGSEGLVSQQVEAQPPAPSQDQPAQNVTPEAPQVNAPEISAIASTNPSQTAFQMPTAVAIAAPSVTAVATNAASVPHAAAAGMGNIPSAMAGRMGGRRMAAMMDKGGKQSSEAAVIAGLNWLKAHQSDDGSWSDEYKPSMTGLALLCFLGHGELQESADYGVTVKKAIEWLMARGAEFDGRFSLTKDGWGDNSGVYQHGICTYALGEYYSMTQDDRVKDLLTQAVKYVVEGQNSNGSWSYMYDHIKPADTSVTGWQVQALKAAHLTGLNIPGVDDSLDKSMLYFKDAQREDGGFVYQGNDERYAMAGIGTLCTYFWKQDKDRLVHEGIKYIVDKTKKDFPVEYKGPKADLYAWYYDTQACLMFGGEAWTRWNHWFQDEIVNNQAKDGSWPVTPNAAGVGDLQNKAAGAGPFYRTTLCVLMLEVFYRYMPINRT